ncbi:MAG: hypothetical protein QXI12_02230 [Candidatus Methanomethyliaceae archaeon]
MEGKDLHEPGAFVVFLAGCELGSAAAVKACRQPALDCGRDRASGLYPQVRPYG